ncbi:hypothetical protein R3W88_008508 [Solanum pinnatisectum]|uniref:Uncharacterized protein n=1 Tax=Solanum pinnatisectum TaxID=50273 RepID=A0AAV9MBY1_9SOLN|nr:hypothetical protein R3W88_008508 [Solanum pinnatisectum]
MVPQRTSFPITNKRSLFVLLYNDIHQDLNPPLVQSISTLRELSLVAKSIDLTLMRLSCQHWEKKKNVHEVQLVDSLLCMVKALITMDREGTPNFKVKLRRNQFVINDG